MAVTFSNTCSLNKLPIRPPFLFKSSSRYFSIISPPNTRNAGLVLGHNFSGFPTNKLGHDHFARNQGFATKGHNEFSKYVPIHIESHAPDLPLRNGHDHEKVLTLITALLGLLISDQPQHNLGSRSNKNPKETLSQLAALLGLSTHDTHSSTLKRLSSHGEGGNSQSSKRQRTIANSDDTKIGVLPLSNTPSSQLYLTNLPSSKFSSSDDDTDSYSNNSTLSHVDSFLILRRQLYEYPQVQGAFDLVKATLLPILLQKLKTVRPDNVTVKSGLETAASIDLLRLFGASSRELDEIGRRALEGARLLEEGHNKVFNGKGMLECAFADIPNHLERKINSA